jgi:hypothetical protein
MEAQQHCDLSQPSEEAILKARGILAEHLPYQLGQHGRDENGNCRLMLAIAEAIDGGKILELRPT